MKTWKWSIKVWEWDKFPAIVRDGENTVCEIYADPEVNGPLIAAAPELLTALKLARDWIVNARDGDESDCPDEILNAIAKAEGK